MLFALIDSFIIAVLAGLSVIRSDHPLLLLLAAGLLLVAVTAHSMGIHLTWLKWILAACFGVLSGFWPGYIVFAVLWPVGESEPVREDSMNVQSGHHGTLGLWFWLPPSAATILFLGTGVTERWTDLNGQFVARQFLWAMAVMASVTVLLLVKYLICVERQKRLSERERLRQSSVSEMREKKLNRQLAQASFLADKNARLTERENISRNIHNSVGHNITAAIMTLDAADMLYDVKPEEARKRMNDANERIRGSLESIRRAVRTLDQESADVPITDLIAGMDSIMDEFVMDTERKCDRLYDPFPEGMLLPHEHLEFLTGVLQEFLTNGVKHGHADTFLVKLSGDSAHIRLTVKDNGHSDYGKENEKKRLEQGFGLKKILSYAERCGGYAEFSNEDGFRSVVELPVSAEHGLQT